MELSRIELFPGQLLVRLAGQAGGVASPVEVVEHHLSLEVQHRGGDESLKGLHVLLRSSAVLTLVHHIVDTVPLQEDAARFQTALAKAQNAQVRFLIADEKDVISLVTSSQPARGPE